MGLHQNYQSIKTKRTRSIGAEKWLARLDIILQKNLSDPTLRNHTIAESLNISERQLFRKMKALTGSSPNQYLRRYRLQQAMRLMKTGQYSTVKETAHLVGFSKPGYFTKQFEKEFGKKPLQVLQEGGWR